MLKILFIIGIVAGVIIITNAILNSDGKGLFGFLPAKATLQQPGRPLQTVPTLIPERP